MDPSWEGGHSSGPCEQFTESTELVKRRWGVGEKIRSAKFTRSLQGVLRN